MRICKPKPVNKNHTELEIYLGPKSGTNYLKNKLKDKRNDKAYFEPESNPKFLKLWAEPKADPGKQARYNLNQGFSTLYHFGLNFKLS